MPPLRRRLSNGYARCKLNHARPLAVTQVFKGHVFDGLATQVPGPSASRIRVPHFLPVRPQPSADGNRTTNK